MVFNNENEIKKKVSRFENEQKRILVEDILYFLFHVNAIVN